MRAGGFAKLQTHPSNDTTDSGHRVMMMMQVVGENHEITV
jgi:hypothetical protein